MKGWKNYILKLYNPADDEPWIHSVHLTLGLHPLSGPTRLGPTTHTKPISTLLWQAIQRGKHSTNGLWLAAFCSLSIFSIGPHSPRLMARLCNGNLWRAKQHKNTVPCLHLSQWFYGLGEDREPGWVLRNSRVCPGEIFYDWGCSTDPWVRVSFDRAGHELFP